MPDKPTTRRLFFALWPDEATRHAISRQVIPELQNLAGRKVSQHKWHITLAFLGSVTDEIMQCAREQAGKVKGQAFELVLDTVGHWSRPKVVWLGCPELPAELSALVNNLNTQLLGCNYSPEHRQFKAHMTLMRKVTRRPKPFQLQSITWRVNEFVLVESRLDNTGSSYEIIERWQLD